MRKITAILVVLCTSSLFAQFPGEIVARIHKKPVLRVDAPDGNALLGRVLQVLLDEFAKEKKVEVTREEIAAYNEKIAAGMQRSRKEWEVQVISLREELRGDLAAETRKQKQKELETIEGILKSLAAQDTFNREHPSEVKRAGEEVTSTVLRNYKINQALWKEYGGRVIFQQFGPEPLDAYRSLLLEHQKKGTFEILDKSFEQAFWKYVNDEAMHSFFPEEQARWAMTKAWWMEEPKSDR